VTGEGRSDIREPVAHSMSDPDCIPDRLFCARCRYELTGLPNTYCPECGTMYDLADPSTWYTSPTGRRDELVREISFGCVGWITIAILAAFVLLWLLVITLLMAIHLFGPP